MKSIKMNLLSSVVILTLLLTFSNAVGQSADELYNNGLEKIKRLKRVEAKLLFSQAIEKDAKHSKSYYQRGLIHKHFNEKEEALKDFKQVAFLEGDFQTEAHFEIGKIKAKEGSHKDAVIEFSYVIKEDSSNAKAHYLRGLSNIETKQYEAALIDFNETIRLEPKNADAYFEKGLVEVETGRYDDAIATFDIAIEKKPKHANAYFYRAIAHFEEASSEEYDHKKAHLNSALEDFNKALEIDDKIEAAYFDRGEVKMQLRDYIGAIADFKKAIELKPNDLEAHYLKAMCNYHYGYEDIANKEMQDIINMDSTYAAAQYFIAERLYETQKYDEALAEFDKLFQIEDPHADAYVFRGYTKFELGDRIGACADWTEAQKMGDKEAEHDLKKYCKK